LMGNVTELIKYVCNSMTLLSSYGHLSDKLRWAFNEM
jgi:hypothetical protein